MHRLAAILLLTAGLAWGEEPATTVQRDEPGVIAGKLAATLKAELQAAMQAGGPVAAVSACNEKALPLTAAVARDTGWQLRRTSTRTRNPANAPDAWEAAVLARFAQRAAAGEPLAGMDHREIVEIDGMRSERYMKAIVVADGCIVCHGDAVAPPLQATLQRLYPGDKATGYRPGELRGAFSMSRHHD